MKFSILVLSYNCEKSIRAAIDSALMQTWKDVEVICVDDCSTDGTKAVLAGYASDPGFRLITMEKNSGIVCGRKAGISAAVGDYILFLDGDDRLCPDACEKLAGVLEKKKYEILQFGVSLEYSSDTKPEAHFGLSSVFEVVTEPLSGSEIAKAYFSSSRISATIWNKCYSRALAVKVYGHMGEQYINISEDFYFSFVCAYYAQSFFGIADRLYVYTVGSGMSTMKQLSLRQFENYISSYRALDECARFARENSAENYMLKAVEERRHMCILGAQEKLPYMSHDDAVSAMRMLFDGYGTSYVFSVLLERFLYAPKQIAPYIDLRELFPVKRRKISTVGILYHRLYNGGVERVISLMSYILTRAGYKLVVITDEPASSRDYPLAEGVKREVLAGTIPAAVEDFDGRFDKLCDVIKRHEIDVVINNSWMSLSLFWDMAAVKSCGAAFINYCHGTFITSLNYGIPAVDDTTCIGAYADALVTLSESDRLYWSRFNPNTFCVSNPSTFTTADTPAAPLDSHRILWLGRADSGEKNPMDAMLILREVLKTVPDARLSMVGYLPSDCRKKYEDYLTTLGIREHVELPGFSTNVNEYFQRSALLLQTSNFESYCMSMLESITNGVPVVSYAMPYLTICRNSRAITQVGWKDISAAAKAISAILLDDELRLSMGSSAREEAKRLENVDHESIWRNILESSLACTDSERAFSIDAVVFNEIMDEYAIVTKQMCYAIQSNGGVSAGYSSETTMYTNEQVTQMMQKIYNSKRYRIGYIIAYIPGKLATAFKILREHGLGYTLNIARERLAAIFKR